MLEMNFFRLTKIGISSNFTINNVLIIKSITFIYNTAFDPVGTVRTNTIASSTVRAVVIFVNSSSITSFLTIEVTPELDSTIISCTGHAEFREILTTFNCKL